MDFLLLGLIIILFVIFPLHLRSQMVLVLGLLALGWLISQTTGQEFLTQTSSQPFINHRLPISLTLLAFSLLPPLIAVWTTKGKARRYNRRLLAWMLAPAVVVVVWSVVVVNLPDGTTDSLQSGFVHAQILKFGAYTLWLAAITAVVELYIARSK